MSYLAYTSSTYITAKALSDNLNISMSKNIKSYPPLIRWGNSFNMFNNDTDYNNPELIKISSNKLLTYRMLSSHSIPTVEYKLGIPEYFPILIRTTLTGSKGRGIIIVKDESEYDSSYSNYYYSKLLNFSNEYRVHVLGGNVVKVMEKIPLSGDNIIIKNSETCTFKRRNIDIMEYGNKINDIVQQLYSVFPMNLMGLDIGICEGNPYIIEINSAPSLNSLTLELYVNYLKKEIA